MFLGIGQVLGPLYGSYVTDKLKYEGCCDTIALQSLIFGVLYFILADGIGSIKETKIKIANRKNNHWKYYLN